MKKSFKILSSFVLLASLLCFAACEKDDEKENPGINEAYATLEGTSWEGTYVTTINSGYGSNPFNITWTLDFNENSEGFVMLDLDSPAIDHTTVEGDLTYTYDGKSGGVLRYAILDNDKIEVNYTVDAINRTLTAELTFEARHEENGPFFTYGGKTTLHQIR